MSRVRKEIVNLIEANAGLTIQQVAERIGRAHSTASYHLTILVREGTAIAVHDAALDSCPIGSPSVVRIRLACANNRLLLANQCDTPQAGGEG